MTQGFSLMSASERATQNEPDSCFARQQMQTSGEIGFHVNAENPFGHYQDERGCICCILHPQGACWASTGLRQLTLLAAKRRAVMNLMTPWPIHASF